MALVYEGQNPSQYKILVIGDKMTLNKEVALNSEKTHFTPVKDTQGQSSVLFLYLYL
jgi:hypothetical protein